MTMTKAMRQMPGWCANKNSVISNYCVWCVFFHLISMIYSFFCCCENACILGGRQTNRRQDDWWRSPYFVFFALLYYGHKSFDTKDQCSWTDDLCIYTDQTYIQFDILFATLCIIGDWYALQAWAIQLFTLNVHRSHWCMKLSECNLSQLRGDKQFWFSIRFV